MVGEGLSNNKEKLKSIPFFVSFRFMEPLHVACLQHTPYYTSEPQLESFDWQNTWRYYY